MPTVKDLNGKPFEWHGYKGTLRTGIYPMPANNPYVEFVSDDGEPIAVVSVNTAYKIHQPDLLYVKNWSENKGILEAMIEHGYLSKPIHGIESGFVTMWLCRVVAEKSDD